MFGYTCSNEENSRDDLCQCGMKTILIQKKPELQNILRDLDLERNWEFSLGCLY